MILVYVLIVIIVVVLGDLRLSIQMYCDFCEDFLCPYCHVFDELDGSCHDAAIGRNEGLRTTLRRLCIMLFILLAFSFQ